SPSTLSYCSGYKTFKSHNEFRLCDAREQQKLVGNKKLEKAIKKNFDPLLKFVVDVKEYQRRRTMPLTWKDHN
ncbi:23041_t:CDS:2, partial [Racocetra persica]